MMPDPIATPPCPDFLADFSDYLDDSLPADRRAEIQAHFDCCEGCLRHLSAYRRGVARLRNSGVEVDSETFWNGLESRLWVDGHLGAEPERAPSQSWTRPAWAIASAALFAVVVFGAGLWSTQYWPGGVAGEPDARRVVVASGPTSAVGAIPVEAPATSEDEVADGAAESVTRPESAPSTPVPVQRPDRAIVLASATLPAAEPESESGPAVEPRGSAGAWVEREFRRLEEQVERGSWESAPRPAWASGWADPLEVRPTPIGTRVRSAGYAPQQGGLQIWPVEAAVTIP